MKNHIETLTNYEHLKTLAPLILKNMWQCFTCAYFLSFFSISFHENVVAQIKSHFIKNSATVNYTRTENKDNTIKCVWFTHW